MERVEVYSKLELEQRGWAYTTAQTPDLVATHGEIYAKMLAGTLNVGATYEITDFQTMYISNPKATRTKANSFPGTNGYTYSTYAKVPRYILGDNVSTGADGQPHPSEVFHLILTATAPDAFSPIAYLRATPSITEPWRFVLMYDITPYKAFFGVNHKGTIYRMAVPDRNIDVCFDFMNCQWFRGLEEMSDWGDTTAPDGRYFYSFNCFDITARTYRRAELHDMCNIKMTGGMGPEGQEGRLGTAMSLTLSGNYGWYNCGNIVLIGSTFEAATYGVSMAYINVEFGYNITVASMAGAIMGCMMRYMCGDIYLASQWNAVDKIEIHDHVRSVVAITKGKHANFPNNGSVGNTGRLSALVIGRWANSIIINASGSIQSVDLDALSTYAHLVVPSIARFTGNIIGTSASYAGYRSYVDVSNIRISAFFNSRFTGTAGLSTFGVFRSALIGDSETSSKAMVPNGFGYLRNVKIDNPELVRIGYMKYGAADGQGRYFHITGTPGALVVFEDTEMDLQYDSQKLNLSAAPFNQFNQMYVKFLGRSTTSSNYNFRVSWFDEDGAEQSQVVTSVTEV